MNTQKNNTNTRVHNTQKEKLQKKGQTKTKQYITHTTRISHNFQNTQQL